MKARASVDPRRVPVRSIAWLDGGRGFTMRVEQDRSGTDGAFAAWRSVNQNREKNAISKWALGSEDGAPNEGYDARARNAAQPKKE
jgi:hypothetical protein